MSRKSKIRKRKSVKMIKIVVLFLVSTFTVSLADNTPVLIWSSSRSLSDLPQSFTGQTLKTDSFHSNYLQPLTSEPSNNLVIFLQDKLSVEDFTNHADVYNPYSDGGAFKNIKAAMDDQFSVHLSSVTKPKVAIDACVKSFAGNVVRVDNQDEVASLKLKDGESYLIIVSLKPVTGKDEGKAFQENDEAMGKVMHHLNKRGLKYSAIYTAMSSSKVESEENQSGRHLLASAAVENFYNESNIMVYIRSLNLSVTQKDDKLNLDYSEMEFTSSATVNDTIEFTMETKDNSQNGTVKVMMTLGITPLNEWGLMKGSLDFKGNSKFEFTDVPMDYKIVASKGFCYHCTKLRVVPMKFNNSQELDIQLSLNGFQIEAFSNKTMDVFTDNVWDCVEFFTMPIWMGIISTIVIVLILFYGITMLANITTMDRFDDPKGKTITITVNE